MSDPHIPALCEGIIKRRPGSRFHKAYTLDLDRRLRETAIPWSPDLRIEDPTPNYRTPPPRPDARRSAVGIRLSEAEYAVVLSACGDVPPSTWAADTVADALRKPLPPDLGGPAARLDGGRTRAVSVCFSDDDAAEIARIAGMNRASQAAVVRRILLHAVGATEDGTL